jgi:endonuclease-3
LGLSSGKDPLKTERDLLKVIPREKQSDYCHRMVLFGREVCIARKPKCAECELKEICVYKDKK